MLCFLPDREKNSTFCLSNCGKCDIYAVGLHNNVTEREMSRAKVPYIGIKPPNVREKVWIAVVDAWENGLSDREASFRASRDSGIFIKESEIKQWRKDYPDVDALRDFLHSDITSNAKLVIREAIREGSVSTSKWYLERKAPDEFSSKSAIAFEGAAVELSMEDKKEKMAEFMDGIVSDGGGSDE